MTWVKLNSVRKLAEIAWEPGNNLTDPVTIKAVNPADGKVHTRDGVKNDGLAEVAYPVDYHGESHVEILDPDENVIASGTINI